MRIRHIHEIDVPDDGTCGPTIDGCEHKDEATLNAYCIHFKRPLVSDGEKYLPCDSCTEARLSDYNRKAGR